MDNNKIETISNLFEDKEIRSVWDSEKEEYFFSVVDVISALTDSNIPRNYWSDLKRKLKSEGSELHENIVQLKMKAQDGKMRETDTLDTKGIFRLIESVPSSKAEPFKVWLANLGSERIDEVFDPEFLLELGRGFSFVANQQRIKIGSEYYYPDLVFYNRLAKCFVIIDLTYMPSKEELIKIIKDEKELYELAQENEKE